MKKTTFFILILICLVGVPNVNANEGRLDLITIPVDFTKCKLYKLIETVPFYRCLQATYRGEDSVEIKKKYGPPIILEEGTQVDINVYVADSTIERETIGEMSRTFERAAFKAIYDTAFTRSAETHFYTGHFFADYVSILNFNHEGLVESSTIVEGFAPMPEVHLGEEAIKNGYIHTYADAFKYHKGRIVYDLKAYIENNQGKKIYISPRFEEGGSTISSYVYATQEMGMVDGFVENLAWHDAAGLGIPSLAKGMFLFVFERSVKKLVKDKSKEFVNKQALEKTVNVAVNKGVKGTKKKFVRKLNPSRLLGVTAIAGLTLFVSDNHEAKGIPTRFPKKIGEVVGHPSSSLSCDEGRGKPIVLDKESPVLFTNYEDARWIIVQAIRCKMFLNYRLDCSIIIAKAFELGVRVETLEAIAKMTLEYLDTANQLDIIPLEISQLVFSGRDDDEVEIINFLSDLIEDESVKD